MTNLSAIEGIGENYSEKLKSCGVTSLEKLLFKAGTLTGRVALANQSGISPKLISKWVNRADLTRIKGVGGEYADLLELSGVDTVVELAQRNAANLHRRMIEVNTQKNLVRALPSSAHVEDWVNQAKSMSRAIHY
ncbi:MAG: DUF4332 domain-containing protein [Gammaproteobacteria bacterium]|uniref:DUF4332 domain-containing protein n=1 Tax=Pseudomaricurvus alcaniphilus TaxID=1166482 RepID=UPI00140809EF|nr:DUF4332 domain-containing protein [Pseudomaricurvus alcaniphilus]MBR9913062.1 DUF4332 domain-containing protein [Gammaproteobacteria bacterium]NHN35682.1 DUF4332 domain-containing protein [Pseudomaricurvus alcaniphilus]